MCLLLQRNSRSANISPMRLSPCSRERAFWRTGISLRYSSFITTTFESHTHTLTHTLTHTHTHTLTHTHTHTHSLTRTHTLSLTHTHTHTHSHTGLFQTHQEDLQAIRGESHPLTCMYMHVYMHVLLKVWSMHAQAPLCYRSSVRLSCFVLVVTESTTCWSRRPRSSL